MKIMGLPSWLHWTAWAFKILVFALISIILVTVLVTVKWFPEKNLAVLTNSDPTLIFFILFMYILASIPFCFMMSVFFSKGTCKSITTATFHSFWTPIAISWNLDSRINILVKFVDSPTSSNTSCLFSLSIIGVSGIVAGDRRNNLVRSRGFNIFFKISFLWKTYLGVQKKMYLGA